jgi:hypothetical protein
MFLVPFSLQPPYMCVDYECSDRIVLPESFASTYAINDVIQIKNEFNEIIVGVFYATHNLNINTIYVPSSLYLSFSNYDSLTICRLEKHVPQMMYVQLHSKTFDLIMINKGLLNYKSLSAGKSLIVPDHHGVSKLTIVRFIPSTVTTAFVYNSGSIRVQFMLPESPPKEFMFLVKPKPQLDNHVPFSGAGYALDLSGAVATIPAAGAGAAARRRTAAIAKIE